MRSLAVVLGLLVSGCGFIKVTGPGTGGPAGTGSEAGDSSAASAEGGDEAGRLKVAYDDFAANGKCLGKISGGCAHDLREAAGIKEKPHGPYDPVKMWNPRSGPNPDPTWIGNWDKLPATDGYNEANQVFQVIADALIQKASRKKCEEGYKPTYEKLKKADDELQAKIDVALKEATAHDRINALQALRRESWTRKLGARFRIEAELYRQFDGKEQQSAAGWLHVPAPNVEELRPLLSLETETRVYCAGERNRYFDDEVAATKEEIKKSKELPKLNDQEAKALGMNQQWDFKAPFFGAGHGKVTSITRDGQGGTITTESTRDDTFVVGCKETNDRLVVQGGAIRKDTNCSYGTVLYVSSATLTFKDLPKFALEKGDEVEFLSSVTEHQEKTTNKGPRKKTVEHKFKGDGLFVVSVKRDGDTKWKLLP